MLGDLIIVIWIIDLSRAMLSSFSRDPILANSDANGPTKRTPIEFVKTIPPSFKVSRLPLSFFHSFFFMQ